MTHISSLEAGLSDLTDPLERTQRLVAGLCPAGGAATGEQSVWLYGYNQIMRRIVALALLASLTGCNWVTSPGGGAVVQLGIWAGTAVVGGVIALAEEIEGDDAGEEPPTEGQRRRKSAASVRPSARGCHSMPARSPARMFSK